MTRSLASYRSLWVWAPLLLLAACGPAPTISSFTAEPDHIHFGDSTRLSWAVKDAASLEVDNGAGAVAKDATGISVTPTQTTTYTLTAKNTWGATSTAQVTVTLVPQLQVVGGTYNAGGALGLTLAALLRDTAGVPPAADTALTISPPPTASSTTPFTVTCPGRQALCMLALPSQAPASGNYQARATVSGTDITVTFPVNITSRLPQAAPIVVSRQSATTLQANWQPVDGAASYRVTPIDFSAPDQPFGQPQVVTGLTATVTTSQPMSSTGIYGVAVEAAPMDLSYQTAPAPLKTPNISRALGRNGGRPDGWQYFDPSRWSGNTLTVNFTDLQPSESLAIIVINAGGSENAASQLTVTGTGTPPPPPPLAPTRLLADASADGLGLRTPDAWHQLERQEEASIVAGIKSGALPRRAAPAPRLPTPMPAAPASTNFCVRQGLSNPPYYVRKNATLKAETTHVVIYVDNNDLSQYTAQEPGIWDTLTNLWETKIYPGDTGTFGAESDVDGNGKLIVFLSGELGAPTSSGILLGYYAANDVYYSQDTTAACTAANGKGSNYADMFYLNSLNNILAAGATATDTINRVYPDTLAHEFQHLINFNQHVFVHQGGTLEDTWINEGLSMVAEEIGGYGWNIDKGRRTGALYMDRLTGANLSYNGRSLTYWEGDPVGNYEAAHSFFRYYTDRVGSQILGSLVQTDQVGLTNLSSALGLSFARAYAEWTTAVFFSNELLTPVVDQFDFKGANWTPLHTQLRHLNYVSLPANSPQSLLLRKDGWNAFLTGYAVGGAGSITLTTSETVKPTVVVARFTGTLPTK